jgi:phytoene synthase
MSEITYEQALRECRTMIRTGSKSFSLAAAIFGDEERSAAFLLYGWCRYCDDAIDDLAHDPLEQTRQLESLRERTRAAFAGERMTDPVFVAFQHVVKRYAIPSHYALELLEGMAMDVAKQTYATLPDLMLYCYRVAGTVGLMMCHIMRVSDPRALAHACDLGSAMQLTNISRDVLDDVAMGRVYLPLDWLAAEGVRPGEIALPKNRAAVARVVKRLLTHAEKFYRSGDQGLQYLAFRPSCAIKAARNVYSEIGVQVARRGQHAWDERVWIRTGRKCWVMARGVLSVMASLPVRWRSPWRPRPIDSIWRFT